MRSAVRIRLSTMLLIVVILALLVRLYILKRSEAKLQVELSSYRDPVAEGIVDLMNRPLGLTYPDGAPLEQLLKDIKKCSTGQPKLTAGIPIYVDPIGLSEADKTMTSTVKRPPSDQKLIFREHLKSVLKPLGLGFAIRDGFLMITSEEAALDERSDDDPYLGYRDVLR